LKCKTVFNTFFDNTFANLPEGYYGITVNSKDAAGNTVSTKKMMSVNNMPSGCKLANNTNKGIIPITSSGDYIKDETKCKNVFDTYNKGNDVEYDANNLSSYSFANKEKSGEQKESQQTNFGVNLSLVKPPPIYYDPSSYTFGAIGYVPDYERSVYLSKTTNASQVQDITSGAPYLHGGFCKQYENDAQNMEQKCQSLDTQTCASTGCCVLLGGQKCVSGDDSGPKMKANYSDKSVVNRDFYYYQGKCFGNCTSNSSQK
jgi:hypothetical protein